MGARTGFILLTIRFVREDDQWAAECLELGTATCADSLEEAKDAISKLVELHLNALQDVGTCEKFLRAQGIRIHSQMPRESRMSVQVSLGEFVTRLSEPVPCGAAP